MGVWKLPDATDSGRDYFKAENHSSGTEMKVLQTHYRGFYFRSRTEARWAVFMDSLEIPFEYEPEAYDLDGICYLPDFWLPDQDCFLEVKPNREATHEETVKAARLAIFTKKDVFISKGPPTLQLNGFTWICYQPATDKRGDQMLCGESRFWCECPHCGRLELQFDGRSDRIKCGCPKSEHGDKGYNFDSPRLSKAYNAAQSYRFEPKANQG